MFPKCIPTRSKILSDKFYIVWLSACLSESLITQSCLSLSHKTVHNSLSLFRLQGEMKLTLGFIFSSKVKSLYKDESASVCVFQQHSKSQRWYQWHEKYHTYYFTSINIQRRTIYSTEGPGGRVGGGREPCILYGGALKVRCYLLGILSASRSTTPTAKYFAGSECRGQNKEYLDKILR